MGSISGHNTTTVLSLHKYVAEITVHKGKTQASAKGKKDLFFWENISLTLSSVKTGGWVVIETPILLPLENIDTFTHFSEKMWNGGLMIRQNLNFMGHNIMTNTTT